MVSEKRFLEVIGVSREGYIQNAGPTTKKAQFCLVEVRIRGTLRRPRCSDRRKWEPRALRKVG